MKGGDIMNSVLAQILVEAASAALLYIMSDDE